tara:strand:+ start:9932 stop:10885 length:954 start_codon:yes stop_codon:yes gene_type:complete
MQSIIVLGSGQSGSGAIKDYLIGRKDIFDPLDGREFRLIQEKDGLSCLHKALTSEFHPDKAMYAILKFKKLAKRLGRKSKKFRIPPKLGYGFSSAIPHYEESINKFINDITAYSFKVAPLRDMLEYKTIDWIKKISGILPNSRKIPLEKPIPVTTEVFYNAVSILFENLFQANNIKFDGISGLLFDQAGSFWSPYSSTKYFGKIRKIIVVKRDPRDIFTQNRHQYGGDLNDFINFYNSVMSHVSNKEWNEEKVFVINFEDFVIDYKNQEKKVCNFLKIDPSCQSTYNPSASKKNIGLYKNFLSKDESELMLNNCIKI